MNSYFVSYSHTNPSGFGFGSIIININEVSSSSDISWIEDQIMKENPHFDNVAVLYFKKLED